MAIVRLKTYTINQNKIRIGVPAKLKPNIE
jgi:hypothetical protein